MKKFTFSLSKMRNYRDQLLDAEKSLLANLKHARDEIERRIISLESDFERLSAEMQEKQAEGIRMHELQKYNFQLDSIRYQVKELRVELEKAQEKVDHQMEQVILASQEVSKLEKLEDRQLEEYNKEAAKAEEKFIDELVSSESIRKMIS